MPCSILLSLTRKDHYRSSGSSERYRYPRDDNIQKIPRLSKKNAPRLSPVDAPPREAVENSADQVSNSECFVELGEEPFQYDKPLPSLVPRPI